MVLHLTVEDDFTFNFVKAKMRRLTPLKLQPYSDLHHLPKKGKIITLVPNCIGLQRIKKWRPESSKSRTNSINYCLFGGSFFFFLPFF